MKQLKNLFVIFFFIFISQQNLQAETYFLDFKYLLNQSEAGKKANLLLKKQLDQGIKKLKDREKQLQKEEKEIIQQKKILSAEIIVVEFLTR